MRLFTFLLVLAFISVGEPARADEEDLPRSRDFLDIPDVTDPAADPVDRVPVKPIEPRPIPKDSGSSSDNFILKKIIFEGTRTYKTKDLYPIYKFFIGKSVSIETLNQITARIERYYKQQGWLATKVIVPAQTISGGTVRIRIFEGRITDIILKGDAGLSKDLIKKGLKSIKTGKPAKLRELEYALGQLQNYSHFTLRPSLKPSESVTGGVDLLVEVLEHKPYSGLFLISNTANDSVGPWTAALLTNFVFAETTLSAYLSNSFLEPDESFVGRLSYERRLDFFGSRIGAYVSGNRTQPDPGSSTSAIDDKGTNFGFYYHLYALRAGAFNISTQFNYDWSRRSTFNKSSGVFSTQGDSNVLTLGLSGNYRSPWSSYTSLTFNVKQGLTEGGGPDNGQQRFTNGIANFDRRATWFTLDLSHIQPLRVQQGFAPGFALSLSGRGQYTFDPLTNNERISFGKTGIGRGFSGGRISGDHGWGLTTELRISWGHIGVVNNRSLIQDLTLYSFFDVAQTFYFNDDDGGRGIDIEARRELFSAGLGARVRWANKFYIDFNWARAINNPYQKRIFVNNIIISGRPSNDGSDLNDKGADDFTVRLYYLF